MGELAAQVTAVVGVLAACFIGPAVAIFFLLRRKRRVRMSRRSPIGMALLRGPGHSLREQLDKAGVDVIFDLMLLMTMPLMVLALFLAQSHIHGLANMVHLALVYAAGALGFVIYVMRKLMKAGLRQGAATFHDIPADNFNIDHVVIAGEGVFAIETKGFTKPKQGRGKADATVVFDGKVLKFPTWTTKEPLEQAERQAAWLAKWLTSALGSTVHVLPVGLRCMPIKMLPNWRA